MALSWKDAVTTVLAAGTGLLVYAKSQNWSSWLTGPRLGILVLGAIGVAMCATGSISMTSGSGWSIILSVMGGLALVLIVAGLITGSALAFYALAADILALWLLATVRHGWGLS
ncbi:MAG TPA: hypothetical protein VLF67_04410 [Candidatus Saccharimonas sp.]|nr:hypothetical protein [Candidatus Saccharimonas sp.]